MRKLAAALFEILIDRRVLEDAERRLPRCDSDGIARERPGLIHRAEGRNELHQLARGAVSADRHPPTDDLAECRDVGLHTIESLGAAVSDAEPGHDFVEDQEGTAL